MAVVGSSLTVFEYWKLNHSSRNDLRATEGQDYSTLRNRENSINSAKAVESESGSTSTKEASGDRINFAANTDAEIQTVVTQTQPPGKVFSFVM